jgi:flavodoxin
MMTRKDYIETAKILNKFSDSIDSHDFDNLIFEFSEWFFSDNPRFDEQKFYDACVDGILANA